MTLVMKWTNHHLEPCYCTHVTERNAKTEELCSHMRPFHSFRASLHRGHSLFDGPGEDRRGRKWNVKGSRHSHLWCAVLWPWLAPLYTFGGPCPYAPSVVLAYFRPHAHTSLRFATCSILHLLYGVHSLLFRLPARGQIWSHLPQRAVHCASFAHHIFPTLNTATRPPTHNLNLSPTTIPLLPLPPPPPCSPPPPPPPPSHTSTKPPLSPSTLYSSTPYILPHNSDLFRSPSASASPPAPLFLSIWLPFQCACLPKLRALLPSPPRSPKR